MLSLSDTLVPGIEGTITALLSSVESGFTLYVSDCGVDTFSFTPSSSVALGVTPSVTGNIVATVGKEGYNLYCGEFPVVDVYGIISGTVRDSMTSNLLGGASVQIYRGESPEPIFEVFTDDSGEFTIPDSLKVGSFVAKVMNFGYEDHTDTLFLLRGPNAYEIEMVPGERAILSGVVNLKDRGDNSGVIIKARYEDYVFSTTDDDRGNYFLNLPPDVVYTVGAHKEGYTGDGEEGVGVPRTDANFTLYPITTLYFSDFEDDEGDATGTSDWQWGVPTTGPSDAHSGEKLWATNLNGNYRNSSNSELTTSDVFLPDVSYIELSFRHWYNMEGYYDGGNVKVSSDGGFTVVEPRGGYPEDAVSSGNYGIPGEPAYSGESGGWEEATFNMTKYAGDTVNLRFHFGSDHSATCSGWYVDDVWVGYVDSAGIHDVGVLSISLPDTVYKDSTYVPAASIYNYGVQESPFPVTCSMEDYTDTVIVDAPPETRVDVEFDGWRPAVGDTVITARVETGLMEDGADRNNAMDKEICVVIGVHGDIPEKYILYQNTPNPFLDATTIRYAIPEEGKVSLEIYNVLGQRVCLLERGEREAGFYDVKWDGRDSRGVRVSGGVYFVRFSSGDFHSISKLVKVR
ncbi:hypothetical protein CH333_02100 [candidate division WOR-3 bacterium JGI_Cruoil_03_44_89]|uniref:FlgD/Vpr Ig-like domain-containing protein n=1 Tax=candidate division WOR-3 bacterium JGI_Cruoil_03_44_89 TaxID=1973748 RepID=A0A235BXW3_UNCW3|nr:MAG: hypothetical protein CH333_02100 [candidate division WOR-3 bacterium JGI_Cruoil_03_44_89]